MRVDCDKLLNSLILRLPPVEDLETTDTVDDDLQDDVVVVVVVVVVTELIILTWEDSC